MQNGGVKPLPVLSASQTEILESLNKCSASFRGELLHNLLYNAPHLLFPSDSHEIPFVHNPLAHIKPYDAIMIGHYKPLIDSHLTKSSSN
jgi:hypothetical protein